MAIQRDSPRDDTWVGVPGPWMFGEPVYSTIGYIDDRDISWLEDLFPYRDTESLEDLVRVPGSPVYTTEERSVKMRIIYVQYAARIARRALRAWRCNRCHAAYMWKAN